MTPREKLRDLGEKFASQWRKQTEKNAPVIVKAVKSWISNNVEHYEPNESDVWLVDKLFKIFTENLPDVLQIYSNANQIDEEKLKQIVRNSLEEDSDFAQDLKRKKESLQNSDNPGNLVKVLKKIWNSEDIDINESIKEIKELQAQRIVRVNSEGNPVPANWIYREFINLDDIQVGDVDSGPETSSSSDSQGETISPPSVPLPDKAGKWQKLFGMVLVWGGGLLGLLVILVVGITRQPPDPIPPDPIPPDPINKKCLEFGNKIRDFNINSQGNIVRERDSLIEDINSFLKDHSSNHLGSLCSSDELELSWSQILYTQSMRLAESKIYGGSKLIRNDGESSSYGAVRSLCLISKESLDSFRVLKDVKSKMKKWRVRKGLDRQGKVIGEVVEIELTKLDFCPAADS